MCKCIACVASISMRFQAKNEERVENCVKNGARKRVGWGWGRVPLPSPSPSFIFWRSFHFSHGQNGKSGSSSFLGHSLFRNHTEILSNLLASVFRSVLIRSLNSNKNNGHKRPLRLPVHFKTLFDKINYFKRTRLSKS